MKGRSARSSPAADAGSISETTRPIPLSELRPELAETITTQVVASIEVPWLLTVMAMLWRQGSKIVDIGIVQHIETNGQTAFPVVADPSFTWWIGTAASCAANIATLFIAVGWAAKLARATKILNRIPKLKTAVNALGGIKGSLKAIAGWVRSLAVCRSPRRQNWRRLRVLAFSNFSMHLGSATVGRLSENSGRPRCGRIEEAVTWENEILEIAVLGTCLGCLAALAFSSMPAVGWGPNDFRAERVAKPGPMLLAGFVLVVVPWLVLQRAGGCDEPPHSRGPLVPDGDRLDLGSDSRSHRTRDPRPRRVS